jgi:hypothetical protein
MAAVFASNLPDVTLQNGEGGTHTIKAGTHKFVLIALADHANDEGRGAYPSIAKLENKTNLCRRTVQRSLDALAQLGIIKLVGKSEYGTDDYTIDKSKLTTIYGGDSGSQSHRGGDSGSSKPDPESRTSDSGSQKLDPESPESSFNHPKTSFSTIVEKTEKIPEFVYWETIVETIIQNHSFFPAHPSRKKLELCVPKRWEREEKTLVIQSAEPEFMTDHFAKTADRILQALCPGGAIRFEAG